MLAQQKELLGQVSAAAGAALAIYNKGVKIRHVVENLRAAEKELTARVRALEKAAPSPPPPPPPKPAPPAPPAPAFKPKTKPDLN